LLYVTGRPVFAWVGQCKNGLAIGERTGNWQLGVGNWRNITAAPRALAAGRSLGYWLFLAGYWIFIRALAACLSGLNELHLALLIRRKPKGYETDGEKGREGRKKSR